MKVCGNFVGRFFEDIFCGFRKSAYWRKRFANKLVLRSVGDILELFERSGCYIGGWGKAAGNTTEGELSLRRHSKEEKKPVDQVIPGGVPEEESWCGDRKVRLQSSSVRSCEKAMATKGPALQ